MYQRFDSHRKVPRLPGPPYHFITRILTLNSQPGGMQADGAVTVEYDIPEDAWYFSENSYPNMPFCVLMESALQPCGWLASLSGCTLQGDTDFLFRNLDGTGTLSQALTPTSGTLRTEVRLKSISPSAGMIIVSFHVDSYLKQKCVYTMDTVFGFFPESAFIQQAGLPVPPQEKTTLNAESNILIDLTAAPAAYFSASARLPGPQLLMIDRITGYWPSQGKYGKGQLRAEKTVNPADWFFKAHFFRDPVQPGSLGVEAMLQVVQFYMLHENLHQSLTNPHFQSLYLEKPITWKYRGQVVPENKCITILVDIAEVHVEEHSVSVVADASLWVDGIRIYEVTQAGMQLVEAG
jgi:3-hydroxymyristoyl/3-hydroxydecanoyl-(acyl carrier protein) dehydratase